MGYEEPAKSLGFGLISKCFSIDREGGGQMARAFSVPCVAEFQFREKGDLNDFFADLWLISFPSFESFYLIHTCGIKINPVRCSKAS